MIPSSSSNRVPGRCDAVLTIASPNDLVTSTRSAVGPLRLPLKDPESFVTRFNRIYGKIGLHIEVADDAEAFPPMLDIRKTTMQTKSSLESISPESLQQKNCVPCEGGVPRIDADAAEAYLQSVPNWSLEDEGRKICRKINAGNFSKAIQIIQQIAELAESEQHHPDLHLTGYRHLSIDLTTHAIGGLSENDFVIAAKIDTLT